MPFHLIGGSTLGFAPKIIPLLCPTCSGVRSTLPWAVMRYCGPLGRDARDSARDAKGGQGSGVFLARTSGSGLSTMKTGRAVIPSQTEFFRLITEGRKCPCPKTWVEHIPVRFPEETLCRLLYLTPSIFLKLPKP